jgi:hypothetical protein
MAVRRFRLRFTLLGLLSFTALCALGTQGYLTWQAHRARKHLEWAQSIIDVGAELQQPRSESSVSVYCRASERLCLAECMMPWTDRAKVKRAHLQRIDRLQDRFDALSETTMFAEWPPRDLLVLREYRRRAEEMVADSEP